MPVNMTMTYDDLIISDFCSAQIKAILFSFDIEHPPHTAFITDNKRTYPYCYICHFILLYHHVLLNSKYVMLEYLYPI